MNQPELLSGRCLLPWPPAAQQGSLHGTNKQAAHSATTTHPELLNGRRLLPRPAAAPQINLHGTSSTRHKHTSPTLSSGMAAACCSTRGFPTRQQASSNQQTLQPHATHPELLDGRRLLLHALLVRRRHRLHVSHLTAEGLVLGGDLRAKAG